MGMPGMPEMLIILAIVVLLFGAKKIPDLAKGMGKGIKDFKEAMKDDDSNEVVEVAKKEETKLEDKANEVKTEVKEETKV